MVIGQGGKEGTPLINLEG